MIIGEELVHRAERAAALDCAAVAMRMAELSPGSSSVAVPLAGGQVVLQGPGVYVNRGMAMGLGVEVTSEDLDELEHLATQVGVPPEIEVCPLAHESLIDLTGRRGYVPVWFRSAFVRRLGPEDLTPPSAAGRITIETLGDDLLGVWQDTMAAGYGHTGERRRVSDLYCTAAHGVAGTTFFLARIDGSAVGVASLISRDGVAILGGMATIPSARRQGVQTALIHSRLAAAAAAGCGIATTGAAPGGPSGPTPPTCATATSTPRSCRRPVS